MPHLQGDLDGAGLRVTVVASTFNEAVVDGLVHGAVHELRRHGVAEADVRVIRVPGAWELPVVVAHVLRAGGVDAVVALGAVVRGETPHFDYVAAQAARVGDLAVTHGVPVGFGLLTTDTWEQAVARAGGKAGNKGREAALAALETARLLAALGPAGDGGG